MEARTYTLTNISTYWYTYQQSFNVVSGVRHAKNLSIKPSEAPTTNSKASMPKYVSKQNTTPSKT